MKTKHVAFFLLTFALLCPPTFAQDRDLLETIDQLKEHAFSEIEENPELRRKWWDMIWTAWEPTPEQYQPDFTDFDKSRYFEAPPEPYVHPRVFLRPEQLPELRGRLADTRSGQVFYKRYQDECEKLYADSPAGQLYAGLIEGRSGEAFDALFQANIFETSLLMMYESLRILIDDDREAGEKMARATATYAERLQKLYDEKGIGTAHYFYENIRNLPAYMKEKTLGDKGYQDITAMFQEYNITMIYDFLYPYMDEAQRKVTRALIADLSSDLWIHGMGIPDTGGNWGPHHWKGAIAAICIEGEEGYDPDTVKGLRQAMTSFYSGDFTRSGAVWEGLGKGTFGTEGLMVATQRGWDLAATQPVRRAVSRFILHSMLPDRQHLMSLGGLGSSRDTVREKSKFSYVLKYFYPDDAFIDYLYRLSVGEDYQNLAGFKFNRHYAGIRRPLRMLIGIMDYDEGRTLEEASDAAVAAEGNTFFCPEFSLLSTRQDWSGDAAWLHFFVRSYNYGHTRSERGHFTYAALGRQWSIYSWGRGSSPHASSYDPHNCSVMTVDNIGTLGQPGKMIAFADTGLATFATADLKHSWDWRDQSHNNPSDRVSPLTLASLQPLDDDPFAWHHLPMSLFPHWLQPGRLSGPDNRVPHVPVEHAYRTAGLVRGGHPYALILDDMRLATPAGEEPGTHLYTWNMALPDDLVLEKVNGGDITLAEKEGDRKLLVRVLQTSEDGGEAPALKRVRVESFDSGITGSRSSKRLTLSTEAVGVRMKVLLFAYRPGDPLPVTTPRGNNFDIVWPEQRDELTFEIDGEGMTRLTLQRAGEESVTLTPRHVPLPGKPPIPAAGRGYEQDPAETAGHARPVSQDL